MDWYSGTLNDCTGLPGLVRARVWECAAWDGAAAHCRVERCMGWQVCIPVCFNHCWVIFVFEIERAPKLFGRGRKKISQHVKPVIVHVCRHYKISNSKKKRQGD